MPDKTSKVFNFCSTNVENISIATADVININGNAIRLRSFLTKSDITNKIAKTPERMYAIFEPTNKATIRAVR